MLRRVFQAASYVPTPVADTTTYTSGTFQAIGSFGANSGLNVVEIWVNGQAAATDVKLMQFARDHVLGATVTALAAPNSDGEFSPGVAASPVAQPVVFVAATTNPQRSTLTSAPRLPLTINAFGGIAKWQANPWEAWQIEGITVDVSESSLSAYTFAGTSTGAISSMIVYECF